MKNDLHEDFKELISLLSDIRKEADRLPSHKAEIVHLFFQFRISFPAISYISELTPDEIQNIINDFILQLFSKCTRLQKLLISSSLDNTCDKNLYGIIDTRTKSALKEKLTQSVKEEMSDSLGTRIKDLIEIALDIGTPDAPPERCEEILSKIFQTTQYIHEDKSEETNCLIDISQLNLHKNSVYDQQFFVDKSKHNPNKETYFSLSDTSLMAPAGAINACGLFGIFGDSDAVEITYFGLHGLQHRGQDSAGIAASDGCVINCFKGMGVVRRVFRAGGDVLNKLRNPIAVGHVGCTPYGTSNVINSQPHLLKYFGGQVAIAFNGVFLNEELLRDEYEAYGNIFNSNNAAEIILHLLAKPTHRSKPDPLAHILNHLKGAYSLLLLFPDRIEAVRDPLGIKPLCLGQTKKGSYVVASEKCAFDITEAKYIRDVEPGEIITLDKTGYSSRFFVDRSTITPAHCMYELIYYAEPSSRIFSTNVYEFRKKIGMQLAIECPVEADSVIPIPHTAIPAAIGYSYKSKIPFEMGIISSRYIGRTLIDPTQKMRELEVNLKVKFIEEVIYGKRIVLVDDSIVRGTTTRGMVRRLRNVGAKEIHMRVGCPPIRFPCFYGVGFPSKEELLTHRRKIEQIREYIEVDSINYLSLEGLLNCANLPPDHYCTACWTGKYRISPDVSCNKFSIDSLKSDISFELGQ